VDPPVVVPVVDPPVEPLVVLPPDELPPVVVVPFVFPTIGRPVVVVEVPPVLFPLPAVPPFVPDDELDVQPAASTASARSCARVREFMIRPPRISGPHGRTEAR
jgi:hypothetical protein